MTKIFRRSKFITFILVLAVLLCSTAFAFADSEPFEAHLGYWYAVNSTNTMYNFATNGAFTVRTYNTNAIRNSIGSNVPNGGSIDLSIPHNVTLRFMFNFNDFAGRLYLTSKTGAETSNLNYLNFPNAWKYTGLAPTNLDNCVFESDSYSSWLVPIDFDKPISFDINFENFSFTRTGDGFYDARYPFGFGFYKPLNDYTLNAQLLYYYIDGSLVWSYMPTSSVNYYTYKFNVPSGQMLHIIADDIQEVYAKYNVGFGLFRPSSQTLNANRYNYLVSDYANISAFGNSNIITWSKNDNSSYICNIEHDNFNALNFYNFSFADSERMNNYEVYITCSMAKAFMYSQNWKGQVIESTSSSGALFLGGGNGTTESPYNVHLYDTENSTLYKPSTLEVDTTSQDSAMNTIVNTLTAPSRFIGVITESTGNFMQTISTMFSWLPVELTSVIVGAFSVIIAVGVLKMFL